MRAEFAKTPLAPSDVGELERRIVGLIPMHDVEGEGPCYTAISPRPWLKVEPISAFEPGRWFRLRYRLGLYDRPVRPIISYRCGAEEIGWNFWPGPVLGRGEGICIAPKEATAVLISPVAECGPFSFAIETIEILSYPEIVRLGLAGDRARFLSALGTFFLAWRAESEMNFRWAAQHVPIERWAAYRDKLSVAPDPKLFERPRSDWTKAPVVRLIAHLDDGVVAEAIEATMASLQAQIFPHWTLSFRGCAPPDAARKDPRVARLTEDLADGEPTDLFGVIVAGDRLAPHALACFIEAMQRAPEAVAAYCDEQADFRPLFKPEWSPHLEASRPYVGRLMLTRLSHARGRISAGADWTRKNAFASEMLCDLGRKNVLRIPRILIDTFSAYDRAVRPVVSPRQKNIAAAQVSIVLPTRDRAELLRQSVASILEQTSYKNFELIIVDNGSRDPEALAVLAVAERDPRVRSLKAPGPFNFSQLCNLGAAEVLGDVIVFLNNDIKIIEADWIDELACRALEEKVGAVGCMLLYPNGRIQHAGIVVGMGEEVGHCDAGAEASEPGWLGRNACAHEVSAVTGACLAVERRKFLAAGGFDAENLPVEFNDIDLCLRLEELGYQTLWTPFARVIHLESASRGKATFRRIDKYATERAYFRRLWAGRLRDDPYYHPGLSLFSLSPALG